MPISATNDLFTVVECLLFCVIGQLYQGDIVVRVAFEDAQCAQTGLAKLTEVATFLILVNLSLNKIYY